MTDHEIINHQKYKQLKFYSLRFGCEDDINSFGLSTKIREFGTNGE